MVAVVFLILAIIACWFLFLVAVAYINYRFWRGTNERYDPPTRREEVDK